MLSNWDVMDTEFGHTAAYGSQNVTRETKHKVAGRSRGRLKVSVKGRVTLVRLCMFGVEFLQFRIKARYWLAVRVVKLKAITTSRGKVPQTAEVEIQQISAPRCPRRSGETPLDMNAINAICGDLRTRHSGCPAEPQRTAVDRVIVDPWMFLTQCDPRPSGTVGRGHPQFLTFLKGKI